MTKEEAIKSFEEDNHTMLENKTAYINELKARGMEFENRMVSYIDESVERNELAISALKGGWIPVNSIEDVPKNGKVWVTLKLPFVDTPCVEVFVWIPTEEVWAFVEDFSAVSPLTIKCVTAYMPYVEPEPYKKGE